MITEVMWMKEAWKHGFVKADGIRMHYVTQGEGKLFFLPDLPCNSSLGREGKNARRNVPILQKIYLKKSMKPSRQ